ncbi:hypothetical protein [Nocardia callitridis]|uniref:Uncharacterized protein n=1 Tax=Nocardia callitridis TaxID=648753 RepID=A0ABP9KL58_9NOCA
MPERTLSWRGLAVGAVALVVLALLVAAALRAPYRAQVATDQLGPDRTEPVADYLARSNDSLIGTDDEQHWALVSFTEALAPQQIPEYGAGTRIAQVLHRVSIPRVQTPLVTVSVPEGAAAAVASAADAAWLLPRPVDDRAAAILDVSAARLRAGCECTVGLVVRAPLPQLRNVAARYGVRAVQALPADAAAGYFGVVPLLPEYVDVVRPGPDDGDVPPA